MDELTTEHSCISKKFSKVGKSNVKGILFFMLLLTLIILPVSSSLAVGNAYAFGYWGNQTLRKGHRVYVWTGTPPNGEIWTAAPVVMCQLSPCGGKFVETGWVKGTGWGLGDVLQQYVTYTDVNGVSQQVFHLGNLSQNTWYQFKVMYSNSAARWEAWRFNNVVWYAPNNLGWTRGRRLAAGSENNNDGGWMNVWGWHPEYQPSSGGTWILYNYSSSQTAGGGQIQPAYDYGYHAWSQ